MEGEEVLEAKQVIEDCAAAAPADNPSEEAQPASMGLEKTKAENELKLLQQRASDLKDLIAKEFHLVAERFRSNLQAEPGVDQEPSTSASAEETIEELLKHKSAAHAQLAALVDDTVQPGLASVHSLTKAEVDDIVKKTKDGGRDLRKNKVKQFFELLAKTKRYLTKQGSKARRAPADHAPVVAEPACNPLWTVTHEFVNLLAADGLNACGRPLSATEDSLG